MKQAAAMLRRVAILFAILLSLGLVPVSAHATNVKFVGNVAYSYVGGTAVLTADKVQNLDVGGFSGTLHMELWAFANAYDGNAQFGYKLAEYSLGQLNGGFQFTGISSGTIAFGVPPNGTWHFAMMLTEFTNGSTDNGYTVRDYVNFTALVTFGPPVVNPDYSGAWANPFESGWGLSVVKGASGAYGIIMYHYNQTANPTWYFMSGGSFNGTVYTAPVRMFTGSWFAQPFNTGAVNNTQVGNATINFTSATTATMSYNIGGTVVTTSLNRLSF